MSDSELRRFMRRTTSDLLERVSRCVAELNRSEGGSLKRDEVPGRAKSFLAAALPIVAPVEEFALACVDRRYRAGVESCITLAGDLIGLQEAGGGGLRFAVGIPSYLALRLLLLMGAKTIDDQSYDLAGVVINEPIEVRLMGGQVSYEPLWAQTKLFFPEAFLGYADFPMKHMDDAWQDAPHLAATFASESAYRESLAVFLALLALRHADKAENEQSQFYPGYRLLTGGRTAVQRMASRLGIPKFRQDVAAIQGESDEAFVERWPERARRLNAAKLGGNYLDFGDRDFPASLADNAPSGGP